MSFTAEITGIVITDTKLFNRTGAVGVWSEKIRVAFEAHAVEEAPTGADTGRVNKSRANAHEPVGSLKAKIDSDLNRVGPRQIETIIISGASYSLFVIKGTSTIRSGSARDALGQFAELGPGSGMYLPANPIPGGSAKMRRTVSGQSANNFLARAFDATARTHRSLKGHSMVGSL